MALEGIKNAVDAVRKPARKPEKQPFEHPEGFTTLWTAAKIGRKTLPAGLYFVQAERTGKTDEAGNPAKPKEKLVYIGAPLNVLGRTEAEGGGDWGKLVQFKDHNRIMREIAIPDERLNGDGVEVLKTLSAAGWKNNPRQAGRLIEFLSLVEAEGRITAVFRPGWYHMKGGRRCFVFPDGVIGDTAAERVVYQGAISPKAGRQRKGLYVCKGTLEGWQDLVRRIRRSRMLVFAVLVGFMGPMLGWVDSVGSVIFNFWGKTSVGKTSLIYLGGSVFHHCTRGTVYTWRTTDNALENIFMKYSDSPLPLDDLKQIASRLVGEVVYMLGNDCGKSRMASNSAEQEQRGWNLPVLSSSEDPIKEKIEAAGEEFTGGQAVRAVDLASDAGAGFGVYDELPEGFADAGDLSDYIRDTVNEHCGHAGRAFVSFLVENQARIRKEARERNKAVTDALMTCFSIGAGVKGRDEIGRVARRFALAQVAGDYAIEAGILPLEPGEAAAAIKACFANYLQDKRGEEAQDQGNVMKAVQLFFEQCGDSCFVPIRPADGGGWVSDSSFRVPKRFGFRCEADGVYLVLSRSFGQMSKTHSERQVKAALEKAGILKKKGNEYVSVKRKIDGQRLPAYVVPFSIIGGAAENADGTDGANGE